MGVAEGMVSFNNTGVEFNSFNGEFRTFKPKEGKTYRIHFPSDEVLMRKRHYNPITKKYYRCLEYQGYCPICVAATNKVGEGQYRIKKASDTFGANILVYDTDDNGIPTKPLNAEVNFWSFGADKFVSLRQTMQEWGSLTGVDLLVTCTDAQFQRLTIIAGKDCYYSSDPAFKEVCDRKVEKDSYPLEKMICKEYPLLDVVRDFNLDPNIYVPQEILRQMNPPTVQDMLMQNNVQPMQNNVPPMQSGQVQGQYTPQNVVMPTQPIANQAMPKQAVPQYNTAQYNANQYSTNPASNPMMPQGGFQQVAPEVAESNFADLEDITQML